MNEAREYFAQLTERRRVVDWRRKLTRDGGHSQTIDRIEAFARKLGVFLPPTGFTWETRGGRDKEYLTGDGKEGPYTDRFKGWTLIGQSWKDEDDVDGMTQYYWRTDEFVAVGPGGDIVWGEAPWNMYGSTVTAGPAFLRAARAYGALTDWYPRHDE